MITISTRDYTLNQLKDLEAGLYLASARIYESPECEEQDVCTPKCKAYAICTDLNNTLRYLNKKIKEREALEVYGNPKESE